MSIMTKADGQKIKHTQFTTPR